MVQVFEHSFKLYLPKNEGKVDAEERIPYNAEMLSKVNAPYLEMWSEGG